jgi:phosphohistidine phosphatase SixA
MRLFLVRHAEAAPGEPDELRPLTQAGRAVARDLGERLAVERPDAVISSPLLRARETAEQIARAAGLTAETDDRLAPGATADDLQAALAGRGETVVAVGHQPDCTSIVLALSGHEISFAAGDVHEMQLGGGVGSTESGS